AVAILNGANGVPGREPGNVGGDRMLAGNRNSHLKNTAQQDGIRALRTGTVHRRDLNAQVVDDVFLPRSARGLTQGNICGGHSYPSLWRGGQCQPALWCAVNFLLYGTSGTADRRGPCIANPGTSSETNFLR